LRQCKSKKKEAKSNLKFEWIAKVRWQT
jgi:hypothetical protein